MTRRRGTWVMLAALLAIAGGLVVLFQDGGPAAVSTTAPKAPAPEPLLTRAIAALGGREALAAIRSLEVWSEVVDRGRAMDVRVRLGLPDRYRHDVQTGDAHLVHATDGKTAWARLDDVAVPLESDEIRRIREQMILVRISLLVGLEGSEDVACEEKGLRDGLNWLEVDFRGEGSGTYLLGFDPDTSLLARAEWRLKLKGQVRGAPVALRLTDYRPVDGIMVPFAATFQVEDQPATEDRVREVFLNRPLAAELFVEPPPPVTPPVQRRTTRTGLAAMLGPITGRPDDAERVLLAWLKEHALARNGPVYRVIASGRTVSVGIPVHVPPGQAPPAAVEGAPAVVPMPGEDVLTTVVTPASEEAVAGAERLLREHAAGAGLDEAGPVCHVLWNDDITQVRLPIRARSR